MPITVNEGGTLYELEAVTVNEGGTLYDLDTVHANEDGTLYEIFGKTAKLPETITGNPYSINTGTDAASGTDALDYTGKSSSGSTVKAHNLNRQFTVQKGCTCTVTITGIKAYGSDAPVSTHAIIYIFNADTKIEMLSNQYGNSTTTKSVYLKAGTYDVCARGCAVYVNKSTGSISTGRVGIYFTITFSE